VDSSTYLYEYAIDTSYKYFRSLPSEGHQIALGMIPQQVTSRCPTDRKSTTVQLCKLRKIKQLTGVIYDFSEIFIHRLIADSRQIYRID